MRKVVYIMIPSRSTWRTTGLFGLMASSVERRKSRLRTVIPLSAWITSPTANEFSSPPNPATLAATITPEASLRPGSIWEIFLSISMPRMPSLPTRFFSGSTRLAQEVDIVRTLDDGNFQLQFFGAPENLDFHPITRAQHKHIHAEHGKISDWFVVDAQDDVLNLEPSRFCGSCPA